MEIEKVAKVMKQKLENVIKKAEVNGKKYSNGWEAKTGYIRSQQFINLLHEYIKTEFSQREIEEERIYPPLNNSKPELKITGFLKKKDQDIVIVNNKIKPERRKIDWGPLASEDEYDDYGSIYIENSMIINIRSQMSSIAKNTDTLFERTFAEALNLHIAYPKLILGEVYMIPVYEYDKSAMIANRITFKANRTNLEKYISFFDSINLRKDENDELYKYEKCSLIIIDFSKKMPKVYLSHKELIEDGLISKDFKGNYDSLSITNFAKDLLETYKKRIDNA